MERNNHISTLYMIVLSAMLLVPRTLATTYTVGDNTGWATPISGNPYATWASQHTFYVGDTLVFNFATGSHTVANVTRSAFDSCNTGNPLSIQTTGPASFTLENVGSTYFICTISNHCSLNQKMMVTVNANTSLQPPPPPPPPNNGGIALGISESLSLMYIFIGFLVYVN